MSDEVKKDAPKTFVIGNCKLSEFTNTHDGKEFKSIKVSKFYKKDQESKEWFETDSFSVQELAKLNLLITEYLRIVNPIKVK